MREAGLRSRLRAAQMGSRTCPKFAEHYAHWSMTCQCPKNRDILLAFNDQQAQPSAGVARNLAALPGLRCLPPKQGKNQHHCCKKLHAASVASVGRHWHSGIRARPIRPRSSIGPSPQRSPLRIAQMLGENRHSDREIH